MKKALLGFLCMLVLTVPAAAGNDPQHIGTFGDWKAYTFTDEGGRICFMSSQPSRQEGKFKKRGEVFLFVTHWSAENTKNVVSVSAGYPYRKGGEAVITVDGRDYPLFTEGETAWASDQKTDDAIAAAIQKGSALKIKGVSQRGTQTVDTYSLKGSAEAYRAISKECSM